MVRPEGIALCIAGAFGLLAACEEGPPSSLAEFEEPLALQDSEKKLDISICSPTTANFPSPLTSTNPYFPIAPVGSEWTLEGEEDDASIELVMTILDRTRTIDGVETRVIEERESEDGEVVEISWNYFAETADGTVCYLGEDVDDVEEGEVVDHEGRWCAQDIPDVNKPGILMPSDPHPGMTFQQEVAEAIAEDFAKIVGSGPVTVPSFDTFTETIRFREFNADEGKGDYKVFGKDFGIIIDGPLVLTGFTVGDGEPETEISEQICGS
ncbi:MAG: hypothetical protein ACREMK_01680 [Gemmatimonadota bacterium]